VILRVNNNSSSHLLQIAEKAEAWWEQNAPGGFSARATGIMFEFARAQDEIARGQILGLGFATVAIALILYGIFRDWILASIALLPNAVPVAMIFGVMGLAGIPVDAGTVLVGSFALGIAVDDTIHLTTGFFEESEQGIGGPEALTRSVSRVLPPLLYTTVVIAVGFAAFTLSEFSFTKSIGALTGSVMVLCLVADLTLLPALLLNANVSKRLFTDSARVRAL
jgi:predicted RND superfamily exporter protein